MRRMIALLLWLTPALALSQEAPQSPPASAPATQLDESKLHAEFRREGERVSESCNLSFKAIPGCAYELFTDHPLHIAAGSMPPQNGFGMGAAFVWAKNTTNWRLSWNFDAVGSTGLAWRAGGYMKLVHTPPVVINPVTSSGGGSSSGSKGKKRTAVSVHPYTVFNLYAQSTSLNKLNYFGMGNNTALTGTSIFGMRETIVGGNVIKPVFELPAIRGLNLAFLGEVNGRIVSISGETGQSEPSITTLYTNATAPGLSSQPGFVQLGEGFRVKPSIAKVVHLNYSGRFQQFFAASNSQYSFRRWIADLDHTIDLYSHTQSGLKTTDTKGPDQCAEAQQKCPSISYSRNLSGSIGARLLVSESATSGNSTVPFYFQPTLGGSDIDSSLALGSYRDYRFRAPNFLLLQEKFEHSVWGPFGAQFMADQGRVALTRGDLGFSHMKHSFAAGLTLRAGAFPMVSLMFAWGGHEGHHNIGNMDTSLLGGSARPLLD